MDMGICVPHKGLIRRVCRVTSGFRYAPHPRYDLSPVKGYVLEKCRLKHEDYGMRIDDDWDNIRGVSKLVLCAD